LVADATHLSSLGVCRDGVLTSLIAYSADRERGFHAIVNAR
jgi:hypothetical protein